MPRVVIVTGASGGLGTAVVDAFLRAGDHVVGVARRWQEGETGMLERIAADLNQRDAAAQLIRRVLARHGRIDALVHTAGAFAADGPVEATAESTWRAMFDANLWPAVNVMGPALAAMKERGAGAVVVVGSMAGSEPGADVSAYAASKAAVAALVKSAAAECKSRGVTVNAVLPGTIDTPANRAAMGDANASKWVAPESIASLLVWLCSPAARDVTGAAIPIAGRG